MKAIVIGGVLGGLMMFFWGFVAHMLLPLGDVGLVQATAPQQDAVLAAMHDNFQQGAGIYLLPMDKAAWDDPAQSQAFGARALSLPYAFVAYQPVGVDMMNDMSGNLVKEALTNLLSALLAAYLVSFAAVGLGRRVLLVTLLGIFGWLANTVPLWNWFRFPGDFVLASLVEGAVGWLLAGLVIAWSLRRFAR